MIATSALWLLISLAGDQPKLKASAPSDTAHQKNGNASSGILIAENNKKQPDSDTASAGQHQGGASTTARPAVTSQCVVDYLWRRFNALNDQDEIASLLLIVTTFYLFATVMIWRQMVKSNKHAKAAYEESKKAAEADRDLLRRQLEAYERPWITASVAAGGHVMLSRDGRISLTLTPIITNIGKSVAIDVDYRLALTRLTTDNVQTMRERVEAIQRVRPKGSGFAILPGGVVGDVSEFYELPPTPGDPSPIPHQWLEMFECAGAVFYRFANTEDEHVTRFACTLQVVNAWERITEHLNNDIRDITLTAENIRVAQQIFMTRAT